MQRLRVGIVGCGEVTQLLHLPSLGFLADQFEVVAACDVSATVLNAVADQWRIGGRHADYADLVTRDDVDIVLVANPDAYHAEVGLAAIAAGKHVLIEKPMCMTMREADEIVAAQERAGVMVQVGYMRRYATAFLEACRILPELGPIRLARVHDVLGWNNLFVKNASRVIRADDVPEGIAAAGSMKRESLLTEALGDAPEVLRSAYGLMLGLSAHDISAMRELLGMPKGVLYAAARQGGLYLSAAFDYGDYVCQYETGIDNIARFDAYLEVFGYEQVLKVKYDTPYVRNLPIRLRIVQTDEAGQTIQRDVHPTWDDAFVAEWRQLHVNVTDGRLPKTSPADFRYDLELFAAMVGKMREAAPA
jgi:predicted dehydrogenase